MCRLVRHKDAIMKAIKIRWSNHLKFPTVIMLLLLLLYCTVWEMSAPSRFSNNNSDMYSVRHHCDFLKERDREEKKKRKIRIKGKEKPHSNWKYVMNVYSFSHIPIHSLVLLNSELDSGCACLCVYANPGDKVKKVLIRLYIANETLFLFTFPIFLLSSLLLLLLWLHCRSILVCMKHCYHFSFVIVSLVVDGMKALTNYVSFFVDGFMEMTPFYGVYVSWV